MADFYDRRAEPSGVDETTIGESQRVELPELETIDGAVMQWLGQKEIQISDILARGGFREVPILWAGAERAYQVKKYPNLRDKEGSLILPIISVSVGKEFGLNDKRGQHWANVPAIYDFMGGVLPVGRTIVHGKTAKFQNNRANNLVGQMNYRFDDEFEESRIVHEYHMVPIPQYITIPYEIKIWTGFKQHFNQVLTPLIADAKKGNGRRFVIDYNGHNFEAFMRSVLPEGNDNNMGTEERQFRATIRLEVLGHISGEGDNIKTPRKVRREAYARVKVGTERRVEEF